MTDGKLERLIGHAPVKDLQIARGGSGLTDPGLSLPGDGSVLVISTRSQSVVAERIIERLGPRFGAWIGEAVMHVPEADADRAVELASRCGAGSVIAVGGGSAIGLAKAVALQKDVTIVAIPSTYSGSEMTDIWGITEEAGKVTGRDARVVPAVAIYDAELMRTLPPAIAGPSGINTIAHSVEALYAQNGTELLSEIAEEGIRRMAAALRVICGPGRETEALEPALDEAIHGAILCGSALAKATMGIHHKLCHVLGGTFGLPHAETHTVILPHATAYNSEAAPEAMDAICRALGSGSAPAGLQELAREVGAPTSLGDIGFEERNLDRAADIATESPYYNPRPVDRDSVRALLDDAFHGRDAA